ncbi:hypothetical protein FJV76_14440 [Mesorhizobium sp. WSM4303]|uniref:hypothetical protein n=1 Tax=Mesorhizobium sp. WSM4303 TaxID=2589887 RepID=UPI00115EBD22|nr:hypothetical protein [Mesorhizobium sp. WSM4303]TRD03830.1 hypothetical protein FJV76_14440 [Mesorhizobium sp. WSM4303]
MNKPATEWPERLTLRDTTIHADEGQRIYTTATGYGYEKREYVRADLATRPSAPVTGVKVKLVDAPDWVPWEGAAAIVSDGVILAWTTSETKAKDAIRALLASGEPQVEGPKLDTTVSAETQAALDAIDDNMRSAAMRASTTFFGATPPQVQPAEVADFLVERLHIAFHLCGGNLYREAASILSSQAAEIERLKAELGEAMLVIGTQDSALHAVSAAIGSVRFMDPPDGGSVTLAEQVARMRQELERAEAALTGARSPAFIRKLETYLSIYPGDKELAGMIAALANPTTEGQTDGQ